MLNQPRNHELYYMSRDNLQGHATFNSGRMHETFVSFLKPKFKANSLNFKNYHLSKRLNNDPTYV